MVHLWVFWCLDYLKETIKSPASNAAPAATYFELRLLPESFLFPDINHILM